MMNKAAAATAALDDAIKYLEHLQDLEELQAAEDEPTELPPAGGDEQKLPEVEARVGGNNVLLKILCEKGKGHLGRILGEVERLGLAVVSVGSAEFGTSAIHITIVAQMEKEELKLSGTDMAAAIGSILQAD